MANWKKPVSPYSEKVEYAWKVVDHLSAKGWKFCIIYPCEDTPYDGASVEFYHYTAGSLVSVKEWSMAHGSKDMSSAICLAALQTLNKIQPVVKERN